MRADGFDRGDRDAQDVRAGREAEPVAVGQQGKAVITKTPSAQ